MLGVHGQLLPPSFFEENRAEKHKTVLLWEPNQINVDLHCMSSRTKRQQKPVHIFARQLQFFKQKKTAENSSERFLLSEQNRFS